MFYQYDKIIKLTLTWVYYHKKWNKKKIFKMNLFFIYSDVYYFESIKRYYYNKRNKVTYLWLTCFIFILI